MSGAEQEVVTFELVKKDTYLVKEFIKVNNDWNPLFERLADSGVFGWVFDINKKKKKG